MNVKQSRHSGRIRRVVFCLTTTIKPTSTRYETPSTHSTAHVTTFSTPTCNTHTHTTLPTQRVPDVAFDGARSCRFFGAGRGFFSVNDDAFAAVGSAPTHSCATAVPQSSSASANSTGMTVCMSGNRASLYSANAAVDDDGRNDEPDDDGSGGGDNDAFATPGDVPTSNGGTLGVASAAAAPALDAVPLAVLRKPGGGGEAVSVTVEGVEDDVVGLQYPVATAEQRTPCGPIQNRWPSTVQPATSNS